MEIEEIKPENEQSQESKPILAETLESIKKSQDIATIDPYELLGFTFVKEHKGKQMKAKVQEIIDDENMLIEYGNQDQQLVPYNEILTHYTDQDDKEKWSFDAIQSGSNIPDGTIEIRL